MHHYSGNICKLIKESKGEDQNLAEDGEQGKEKIPSCWLPS